MDSNQPMCCCGNIPVKRGTLIVAVIVTVFAIINVVSTSYKANMYADLRRFHVEEEWKLMETKSQWSSEEVFIAKSIVSVLWSIGEVIVSVLLFVAYCRDNAKLLLPFLITQGILLIFIIGFMAILTLCMFFMGAQIATQFTDISTGNGNSDALALFLSNGFAAIMVGWFCSIVYAYYKQLRGGQAARNHPTIVYHPPSSEYLDPPPNYQQTMKC